MVVLEPFTQFDQEIRLCERLSSRKGEAAEQITQSLRGFDPFLGKLLCRDAPAANGQQIFRTGMNTPPVRLTVRMGAGSFA